MERLPNPAEWNFNKLLLNIAKDIKENELLTLKRMVIGDGILQETEVHEISSTVELFSSLRNNQYLNSRNVSCLQQMLTVIKRKDLIKRAIEYCQQEREEEMIRISKASDEDLESGHSYVRFYFDHLEAGDFNMNFIDYFKMRISTLLFMPVGNIIVSGFEAYNTKCRPPAKPGPGVIITVMMPDLFICILQDILDDSAKLTALRLFGVKRLKIKNMMYTLIEDANTGENCSPLDAHKDLIHELILDRENQPEVWSKQLANKDQFSNTGDLDNRYNEKLSRVNQMSGMSITLWKNFGKLDENTTKPYISHDELQRQCMHGKIARIYPQLAYKKKKKAIDLTSKPDDQEGIPKLE